MMGFSKMAIDGPLENNGAEHLNQKVQEYKQVTENQNRIIEILKKQSKHFEELSKHNMNKSSTMLYKYRSTEQELIRLKHTVEKYENDIRKLREENENLVQKWNYNNDTNNIEVKTWKTKYEKLIKKLEDVEKEKNNLKEELELKLKERSTEKILENENDHDRREHCRELEEKICDTQKQLISAAKEIQHLRKLSTESLKSLEHLMSDNQSLQTENETLKRRIQEVDINICAEIAEYTNEIKNLKQTIEDGVNREQAKDKTIEELQKQNEWLRKEVEIIRECNVYKNEDTNDVQFVKELLMKKESEIECLAKTVKTEIEEKNFLLGNYLKNMEVINGELSISKNLVDELTEENKELKDMLFRVKAEDNSCSTFTESEVQAEVQNKQRDLEDLKAALSEFKVRNNGLESDLENYKILLERIGTENCSLKYEKMLLLTNCNKIKEVFTKKNVIIDSIDNKLKVYEESKLQFETKILNLELRNNQLSEILAKAKNEKEIMNNKLCESQRSITDIENKMHYLKMKINESVSRMLSMQKISANNEQVKKEYKLTLSKLKMMQNEYQLKINELDIFNKRNAELMKIKTENDKCIANLHRENVDLKRQLSKLQSDNMGMEEELLLKSQQIENVKLERELKQIGAEQFEQVNNILKMSLQQLNTDIENNCWHIKMLEEELSNYKGNVSNILEEVKSIKFPTRSREIVTRSVQVQCNAKISKSKSTRIPTKCKTTVASADSSIAEGKPKKVIRATKKDINQITHKPGEHLTQLLGKLNKNNLELKFVIHLLRKDGTDDSSKSCKDITSQTEMHPQESSETNIEENNMAQQNIENMNIGDSTEIMNISYSAEMNLKATHPERNELQQLYKSEPIFSTVGSASSKSISVPNIALSNVKLESDVEISKDVDYLYKNTKVIVSSKTLSVRRCSSTNTIIDLKGSHSGSKNSDHAKSFSIVKNMEHLEAERERWWSNMKTLHQLRSQVQDIKTKLADSNKSSSINAKRCSLANISISTTVPYVPNIIGKFQDQMKRLLSKREIDQIANRYKKIDKIKNW